MKGRGRAEESLTRWRRDLLVLGRQAPDLRRMLGEGFGMRVTTFGDTFARAKKEHDLTWPEIVAKLRAPREFAKKADAPLLKLATFGNRRTDKGALRSDDNLLAVSGVEGDYDGEKVSPDEALAMLERHGIRALIYTSPSHADDKPRWRVLAPFSVELPKHLRDQMIRRVNGALGGILTGESFTLSQTYYYGRINGHPYRCLTTFNDPDDGTCINELEKLDDIAAGPPRVGPDQAGETATDADLRAAILSGGTYHESLRGLAARFAGRGMREADIVATLEGLMGEAQAPRDERWQARQAEIPRLAADACRKFARDAKSGSTPGERGERGDSPRQKPISGGRRAGDQGRFSGEQIAAVLRIAGDKLKPGDFETPEYPMSALGPLAEVCAAIAEGGQMAPAMAGQSLITAAALLTQHRANVRTLHGCKPLSLYALTIAESGEGKSTAEDATLFSVDRYQRGAADDYRAALAEWERAGEKRKKGEPKPETPREVYVKMRDGTVEGIRRAFRQGMPSQGVFSSEAAMMLAGYGMNADNRAKSSANFNTLWDCGEISVARGLDGRLQLYDRRLSLHWQIQPHVAHSALHDPMLATIGFWPRFFVAWPAPGAPQTAQGFHPENDSRITAYWEHCDELLKHPQGDRCHDLTVIESSPEALKLVKQYFERMQTAKIADSLLSPVRAFALRSPELLFRVAGTLAAWAGKDTIDLQAARDAMELATYSLETWRGIFGDRDEAEARRAALQFFVWLLRQPGAGASEVAMLRIGPKPRSKDRRDLALAMLEQAGLAERELDTWYALTEAGA
jgi:hypothetical protein